MYTAPSVLTYFCVLAALAARTSPPTIHRTTTVSLSLGVAPAWLATTLHNCLQQETASFITRTFHGRILMSMDWFKGKSTVQETMVFTITYRVFRTCKFSHHPIPWLCQWCFSTAPGVVKHPQKILRSTQSTRRGIIIRPLPKKHHIYIYIFIYIYLYIYINHLRHGHLWTTWTTDISMFSRLWSPDLELGIQLPHLKPWRAMAYNGIPQRKVSNPWLTLDGNPIASGND